MRNGLLIIFFLCLYFHFQSRPQKVAEMDVVTLKQSAVRATPPMAKAMTTAIPLLENKQNQKNIEIAQTEVDQFSETDSDQDEEVFDEDLTQLPWEDIEEGWKTHLKEFLVNLDPDKAEEMYTAYLDEKKKYLEKVEFSDHQNTETDSSANELEKAHLENLKEIFGEYFTQVESIHKDYVDSVQYLNRSQSKFSVSL